MYNLFRKGLALGILLFIILSCKTTEDSIPQEISEYNIQEIFPEDRSVFLYLDIVKNWEIIRTFANEIKLGNQEIGILEKSSEVYIGSGWDLENGIDLFIKGDFPKKTLEFFLFFSFDWKKVKVGDTKVWKDKNGIYLNIIDNSSILISNRESQFLEIKKSEFIIIGPPFSAYASIPHMDDLVLRELTNGFIKQGVDSIQVGLENNDTDFLINGELGFDSNGKARGFNLLLRLFLRGFLDNHENPFIANISRELEYRVDGNRILIKNIHITKEKMLEILKKLILNNGDADK